MREEFDQLIKSCRTLTVPAAETKSVGLQADAQLAAPNYTNEPLAFMRSISRDSLFITRQLRNHDKSHKC
jgi:hypothetical protein